MKAGDCFRDTDKMTYYTFLFEKDGYANLRVLKDGMISSRQQTPHDIKMFMEKDIYETCEPLSMEDVRGVPCEHTIQLPQGMLIEFDMGTVSGKGRIAGVSQIFIPPLGRTYIVEIVEAEGIDDESYPYSHMAVMESYLHVIGE